MVFAALPTGDWQFWVVSAIALFAGAWIVRGLARVLFPRRKRRGADRRATLTVGGRPVNNSRRNG